VPLVTSDNFYSDLSMASIMIFRIEEDKFFAIIRFPRFLANLFYSSANIVLFIDMKNRIRVFNGNLVTLFKDEVSGPEKILGASIESILTPTPKKIQTNKIAQIKRERQAP